MGTNDKTTIRNFEVNSRKEMKFEKKNETRILKTEIFHDEKNGRIQTVFFLFHNPPGYKTSSCVWRKIMNTKKTDEGHFMRLSYECDFN